MEKYYGNYLGIVVNTNDPENRNRIQVWVPNLTNTLYTNWNSDLTNKTLEYNFDDSDPVFIRLKNSLPWAECASPLIGGGTAMNINPSVQTQPTGSSTEVPVKLPNESTSTFSGSTTTLDNGQVVDSKTGEPIFDTSITDIPSTEFLEESPTEGSNQSTDQLGEDGKTMEVPLPAWSTSVSVAGGFDPQGNPISLTEPEVSNSSSSWEETTPESKQILNNLRIKDLQNNKTVTGSSLNLSQNLNNLQNTGLEAFSGGYNDVETLYFAALIQNKHNNKVNRVTAVNDQWHVNNRPSSNHTKGNKFDLTFNGGVSLSEGGSLVRDVANQYGLVEGKDYKLIDSYHGTGAHVDVELTDSGRNALSKIRTGDSTKIVTSIESQPTNQTAEIENNTLTDPLITAHSANGNPSPAGAAKGVISSPSIGARVWMFFYGGDIQKPVYFAMSISAPEYRQAYQA